MSLRLSLTGARLFCSFPCEEPLPSAHRLLCSVLLILCAKTGAGLHIGNTMTQLLALILEFGFCFCTSVCGAFAIGLLHLDVHFVLFLLLDVLLVIILLLLDLFAGWCKLVDRLLSTRASKPILQHVAVEICKASAMLLLLCSIHLVSQLLGFQLFLKLLSALHLLLVGLRHEDLAILVAILVLLQELVFDNLLLHLAAICRSNHVLDVLGLQLPLCASIAETHPLLLFEDVSTDLLCSRIIPLRCRIDYLIVLEHARVSGLQFQSFALGLHCLRSEFAPRWAHRFGCSLVITIHRFHEHGGDAAGRLARLGTCSLWKLQSTRGSHAAARIARAYLHAEA
mmetsp:Transcript_10716/g.24423  ORF Transcript_10716/g.24423 Transcript_10716/m.24423 type:complete len:340 (+) Transcript_10716:88-1107(+)